MTFLEIIFTVLVLVSTARAVQVELGHDDSNGLAGCDQSSSESPHINIADAWLHAGQKSTVVLRCQICSDYPFYVWWTKDGQSVAETSRTREISFSKNVYILKIKNIREKDFGRYECNAFVNETFKELSQTIEISGVPYPAKFDLPSTWSETTFELSWRVNCSSTSPIIAYKLEFRQSGNSNYLNDGNYEWVVINIPAPRIDSFTTSPTMHHNLEDEEILNFQFNDHGSKRRRQRKHHYHGHIEEYKQSYTLRGLAKGTTYEARVRSRNAFGTSSPSDILQFRTFDQRQASIIQTMELKPSFRSEDENSSASDLPSTPPTIRPVSYIHNDVMVVERGASSEPLSIKSNDGFSSATTLSLFTLHFISMVSGWCFYFA